MGARQVALRRAYRIPGNTGVLLRPFLMRFDAADGKRLPVSC
jgi:hypothetical protein